MYHDYMDYLLYIAATVMVIFLCFVLVLCGFAVYDGVTGISCYSAWADYSPQYDIYGGCTIMWEGNRLPVNMLNIIEVNNEAK